MSLSGDDVAALCLKYRQRADYFMEQARSQQRHKSSLDAMRNVIRLTACASTLKHVAQEIEAELAYKQQRGNPEGATGEDTPKAAP